MASPRSLGQAFIEVNADTSPFARQVRDQLRQLGDDIRQDRDLDLDLDLSQASVARTEAQLRTATRDREVDVRVNQRTLGRNLGLVGRLIGNFTISTIRILGDFFNFGRQIGQVLGEAFGNLSRSIGGTAAASTTLAGSIVQVVAAFAALTAVATILIGIFGVLLALIVPLVQTVQLFLALLPGLAAAAIFGFGPLVLIFTNLGDAIKATTGGAKEFRGEIEDFGPATRGVLTSLRDLVQFFLGLREQMQESFFRPINRSLRNLEENLGPTFADGFNQVASAAGEFAASFIELFDHPEADRFFGNLFDLADLGFGEIGDAIINFTEAIGNLIDESMPNLRRAVDGIANTIDGWADSVNEFAESPDLFDTLLEWEESFEAVRDLLDEIIELVGNLVEGFREDALEVVRDITDAFEELNEFLTSEDAEQFFDGLRVSAQFLLLVLELIIRGFIILISTLGAIEDLILDIKEFFTDLGTAVRQIIDKWIARIVVFATGLFRSIPFARQLRDMFFAVLGLLRRLLSPAEAIRSFIRGIVTFARRARDAVAGILSRARSLLSPFRTARNVLNTAVSFARSLRNALDAAAFWAGRIRDAINSIRPPSLGGLSGLAGGVLGGLFRQEGGIFTRPTPSIIGEAGPEVLIPLSRPQRARDLIAASGLMNLVRGGDGAAAPASTGGMPVIRLEFVSDGSAAGDAVVELVRRGVRVRGGNVQATLGTR